MCTEIGWNSASAVSIYGSSAYKTDTKSSKGPEIEIRRLGLSRRMQRLARLAQEQNVRSQSLHRILHRGNAVSNGRWRINCRYGNQRLVHWPLVGFGLFLHQFQILIFQGASGQCDVICGAFQDRQEVARSGWRVQIQLWDCILLANNKVLKN